MVVKSGIVAELGHETLLKPDLIERALVANEQVKYCFTLLQNACARADAPAARVSDLRRERLAAGVDDATLDEVVGDTMRLDGGRYRVPHAAPLLDRMRAAVTTMIAPLDGAEADDFRRRLAVHDALAAPDDVVTRDLVDAVTSGERRRGDSLHILVMDVHKALNRLQAAIATDVVDGARCYDLSARGRDLVAAFMAGLNRTAPLKFDHPGLATTATEGGGRLTLQNDLGTTDAHVLVVTVEDLTAAVTYTDIHLQRLAFFRDLFARFAVDWSASRQLAAAGFETGGFSLTVGTYAARDMADLKDFLAFLGSRLVFLIDWNRARKRLRPFVGKRGALEVLAWAADADVGHRGFLEIGGEQAVYEAMEFAAAGRLHLGDRLDAMLGTDAATAYLRFVLEAASRGLRSGRTPALIKDEIKIELRRHLKTGAQRFIALAFRHVCYAKEIAGALHAFLARPPESTVAPAAAEHLARRAARWEKEADALLNEARTEVHASRMPESVLAILERADDAVDALEEAAFLLTLLTQHGGGKAPAGLAGLSGLLDEDVRAMVTALECATHITAAGPREDLDDFLAAIQRVYDLEHAADAALRRATAAFAAEAAHFRALFMGVKLAESLEEASDCLAHVAQLLRAFVLDEAMPA